MSGDTIEAGLDLEEIKSLAEAAHDEIATLRALVDALAQRQTEAQEDRDPTSIGGVLHLAGEPGPEGGTDAEYKLIADQIEAAIGCYPLHMHVLVPHAHTRRVSRVIEAISRFRRFEQECAALDTILTKWNFLGFGK